MGNLSKREKTLVVGGTILIIIYLYFNFFLNPIYEKIKIEKGVISDKKSQNLTIQNTKNSNTDNAKKLENLKAKFDDGIQELPSNERNPEIARNLNIMAKKANVNITTVTFGIQATPEVASAANPAATPAVSTNKATIQSSSTKDKLISIPVTIIIKGDYKSTLSFTASIEGDGRFAQIVSSSISSKADNSNILESNIVLSYYFTEGTTENKPTYDFKDDKAGKADLFK